MFIMALRVCFIEVKLTLMLTAQCSGATYNSIVQMQWMLDGFSFFATKSIWRKKKKLENHIPAETHYFHPSRGTVCWRRKKTFVSDIFKFPFGIDCAIHSIPFSTMTAKFSCWLNAKRARNKAVAPRNIQSITKLPIYSPHHYDYFATNRNVIESIPKSHIAPRSNTHKRANTKIKYHQIVDTTPKSIV